MAFAPGTPARHAALTLAGRWGGLNNRLAGHSQNRPTRDYGGVCRSFRRSLGGRWIETGELAAAFDFGADGFEQVLGAEGFFDDQGVGEVGAEVEVVAVAGDEEDTQVREQLAGALG